MRLSEAIVKYRAHLQQSRGAATLKGYDSNMRQFALFMRDPFVHQITDEHVVEYFALMTKLEWDRNSLIPKRQALVNLFTFLKRKGYPVFDPYLIPEVRREFKMPQVATEEEFRTLMDAIPTGPKNASLHVRNRAMTAFLEATGARNGEMCSVNYNPKDKGSPFYLNLDERKVLIKTEKNKGSNPLREVYWTGNDECHNALVAWIEKREAMKKRRVVFPEPDALFVGTMGWQTGQRMTVRGVCIAFRKMSRRAGLKRSIHPHMFRHKFGHDLNKNNANNSTISGMLGHANINSSRIYTMMDNKEMQEAYVRLKTPKDED